METTPRFIPLEHQVVTDNEIRVIGSSTNFCSAQRITMKPEDALNAYKAFVREAKEAGAKVVYRNKTKQRILDLLGDARKCLAEHHAVFDTLVSLWGKKLQTGIPYGYRDDDALNQIFKTQAQNDKFFYRNNPLGALRDIYLDIERRRMRVRGDCHGMTIYL
jgi:hypothetical protein